MLYHYPFLIRTFKEIFCTFIFTLFAITSYAQAPNIIWAKTYGGTKGDFGNWIQQTANDGYIVVGGTYSSDGDVTGFHGGNTDVWVINLKDSNIVWEEALGGSGDDYGYSVATTTDGGYVVAGYTFSNDDDVSGNHGLEDMWVVKLTSGGSIEWQKCLGGSNNDAAQSIQQTKDGGYIVVGWTTSNDGDVSGLHSSTYPDTWVVKLDDTGKIQWQKCLGGSYDEQGWSVAQTTDGGYVVAGSTTSNDGDVSGLHGTVNLYDDYWVVKLDDTGKIVWQKCLGGTSDDQGYCVAATNDGGCIVGGESQSTDGDVTGNHGGVSDAWVVKLTDTGSIAWERCYGGSLEDYAMSIQQTSDGGYLLGGTTNSNDGDVHGNHGSFDYWVLKIAAASGIEWQKCLGGSLVDDANCAIECNDGSYAITGYTTSIDGEVKGYRDSTFTDLDGDVWTVKLTKDTVTDTVTNVVTVNRNDSIKVYPTMVNDGIVHINMPQGFEQAAIRVTNISGQVESVTDDKNEIDRVINLNNLPDGEYVLQVVNQGKVYRYKVIVHKE